MALPEGSVETASIPGWDLLVETLRERKDDNEIARIREAADVATRAIGRTLPDVRAGMTELQVAGLLEKALRDEGSEGFPFPSIVASAKARCRCCLTSGKLFMIASEKTAVPPKAIARTNMLVGILLIIHCSIQT